MDRGSQLFGLIEHSAPRFVIGRYRQAKRAQAAIRKSASETRHNGFTSVRPSFDIRTNGVDAFKVLRQGVRIVTSLANGAPIKAGDG